MVRKLEPSMSRNKACYHDRQTSTELVNWFLDTEYITARHFSNSKVFRGHPLLQLESFEDTQNQTHGLKAFYDSIIVRHQTASCNNRDELMSTEFLITLEGAIVVFQRPKFVGETV